MMSEGEGRGGGGASPGCEGAVPVRCLSGSISSTEWGGWSPSGGQCSPEIPHPYRLTKLQTNKQTSQ